jgi:hypothetical protein
MPSSLKDIYNALREDQQFSQTKDYGTFAKRMNERGYSQMIYNNLKTAGASLPDVNTFRKRLGLKDWSAPSTKPAAKSKSQATPSYADYSATSYSPSSASQGNGVKDKYRYPGLSVPMNANGTEDTASPGNESALVRSLRKSDSRKGQPSLRKPIGKTMVENYDEETKNLRGAASEIANEGEKPAYDLGDETTSQYLSKRKSDVAKEHDKVRSVSEAVWDNASRAAGDEFNDYIKDRNEMNFTNVVRELAKGSSPSRMSEDNWEVGTEAMASHLRNHDLEKLSEAAWDALGENGQKDLIGDYYSKILQQYPHADHNEAYEEAKKMARAESDNQMYQTAVSKNAPKDVTDFFFRKAARTNSLGNIMEANARIKAGTRGDMDARDEADANYEQDHKVAGITGMVTGFATDPLTAVSGSVGSATAKGVTALAGKAFGQAAVRKFGTTLGGKILTGAAAGMGNLGTLEAGSNAAEQLRQGGWRDDEGKFHEGFAEGQVLKQGLHGAGMGALTGVVSPVIGNVADKAVRATSNTAGKIGIRAGEVGTSILAEGTIFSVPEWMEGKRDKMDVWTDNLAQMAGMKVQGGFKTVANTIAGLHGNAKTGFRERLNGILDGNRQDLALTKDERAELEQGGYTDLKQLTDDAVASKGKKTATKDGKTATTSDDGKNVPVNRFEQLMADKNISEAARAKMYYYLTGHTLPMSTVTGGSMTMIKDADGKVTGYTVESTGYNGVITRRHFTDRKSADREMDRVHRQAELNNVGIGERLYDEKTVKDGKPIEEGSAKLRSDIMDEYGIDVNEAYKKPYDKRSEEEQEAIDAYSDRLYDANESSSSEDADPMGLSVAEREGADIVEENHLGTETPDTEAVQSTVTELRQAQTAWAEAMKSDTSLAEGFKAAQEKGLGMVEAYEWMLEQGYGTEESLAPLADVIGASVKVASMWRGTKESIEKTTQEHVSTWQWEGTDFGQGEVTEPTMLYVTDKNGHRLIVKSGHIKFDANGNAIEGDMIICLDETTGDMVHPSVKDVKFQGTESAKDYADRYRQRLQEINSKGYETLPVTPAEAESKPEDKTSPEGTTELELPLSEEPAKTEPSEANQDTPTEGELGTPNNGKIEGNYDKESGIPLDEEGEPLYEQVPKEQTVEDIFGKLDDANLARDYAKHKVSEAEKKLKSVSGNAPKMGTKINEYARKKAEYEAKVEEAQASVDYWKSVVEDIEKLTHTTDEELAEQKRELDGTAAKEEMKDNHEADVPDSGVALAASVLADAKITPDSLKKETGYGTKDLNKFVGMLAKKENGGVDLISLAEKLVEMDEQYNNRFFGGDAQEARNALLEALGQAKTRGELRALARPDEAKAIKEREEQRDKAYHDAYGMSYEEYLDFAEQEMAHLIGDMAHFDEEKYLQDYAAEITKQIDKEHGTGIEGHESAGEEPVHGTGGEVLSGEGVDDRGGSGSVEGHGEGKEEVRGGDRADAALEGEASGEVDEAHPIEGKKSKPQSSKQERENHTYSKQPLKERTRKACESVAKELGMDIEWVDHLESNGLFTTKDENGDNLARPLIRIARDAENPLTTVFGHEGIHAVRNLSEEAYQSLIKTAMSVVGDAEWQKRFDATKERYKKQNLTDDEIAEEVVADIVGEMITNRDMTEKIASRLSHPVLSALRDVAHKIWEAIKTFVGKGTTLNEQEQAVKDFTDAIERAFVEAKKKAKEREVYANEAPAPSAERVSEVLSQNVKDYDPVSVPWGKGDLIGDNTTPTRYSSRASIEGAGLKPNTDDGGRVTYSFGGKKFDKDHPVTPNDLKRIHSPFMSLVKYCEEAGTLKDADVVVSKYCDLLNLFLKKGDKGFDALSDEFAWSGEALFKTVSNNSDAQYKKSVDITRLCKKNEAVIYAICELQKRQGYGATPGQILDIYEATNDQGYQVPCPVCYVFSRYVANGQYATALISGQKFFGKYLKDPSTMTPKQREKYVADWCARLAEVKAWKAKNSKAIAQAKSDIITILQQVDAISEDITSGKLKGDALTVAKQHIRALDKLYRDALNLTAKASLDGWITNIAIMKKGGKKIAEEAESSDTEEVLSVDPKDYDAREDSWRAYPEDMALDLRKTAEAEREYPGIVRFRRTRGAAAGKAIQFAADNKIGELVELLGKSGIEDKNKNYSALQKAFVETDEATRNKYLKEAQTNIRNAVIYAARQSLRGGIRQWSWSDNIERLMPDVFINLLQEHMLGAAVQAYSKQLEGIEMVAAMNGYINGSLMGKGLGIREVSADYTDGPVYYEPRDGKYYTLEFDNVVGVEPFSHDGKLGLFDLNKMYDRAGNILVGMSNTHIRAALADPRIFFVIPWHASGANNHVLMQMYKFLGIDTTDLSRNATDYTKTQEDKRFSASDNVTSSDREVWEEHNCNDKYKCGIGTIESGTVGTVDGKQVIRLSEGQKRYRALRDAILTTDMRKPITTLTDAQRKKLTEEREAGSSVTEAERIAELEAERQRNLKEIENDEFLSQVLRKQERLHEMGTTMEKEDCNHIYPYEYWDETSTFDTADVNGERYLEYCRRMGFRPKFCGIADGKREDTGNFVNDKGYWKLLIDRRMYKCDGNFQDLTPVTVDGFSTDLIDRDVIEKRVPVTRVANGDETNGIVDQVQEAERQRGLNSKQFVPQVNYDMSFDKAAERYQKTSDRESVLSNTRKYIEEKNMRKAEARAKAKADLEKRKAKGTKYSLRDGAVSTDEAENENIYLSLRNKKGKEYNDTVTKLARERSAKRNDVEVDGSLSDKDGGTGVQERSTQRSSGERQENVGLLPDAIRIIAEDRRRVTTEGRPSGDRRDGTERGRGVLSSDGDGVFQGEDSRRRSSIENKVEEWAKANGLYVDEEDVRNASDGENVFKHGGESKVYLSKDGKTITKFVKYWAHDRADLGEFIDFVDEYNKVFQESRYKVIGVSRDNRGQLRVVVEQPYTEGERVSRTDWIKAGRYEKVKEYFESKGFKETGFGVFSNGDTVVSDIHHDNVIFRNGEPVVIDADINSLDGLRGRWQGYAIQGAGGLSNIINGLGRLRDSVLRADMDEINRLIEDVKKTENEASHHYSIASESESSTVKHGPADVAEHIAKVAEKTGGKVEQVNSIEEITNEKVKADIAKGKKVQGWYDEKTGKVYLFMPNIHDRYTAERVVWHETVGHKGMRGLLGDEGFKQYMQSLWYDLDNPVNAELRQYVRDRMAKDHLSMYDAIEEFIAESAEKGKGSAGFWNNVKNKVSDVLHEIGYRISPNVKDVQYMLWLAKNVQKNPNDPVWKMRAEAAKWKIEHSDMHLSEERGGEIADTGVHKSTDGMTDAEIERETDCKVHYSTAPSTATEIDLYNRAVGNVRAMLKESYQDSMNSLTELMKVLIPGMKRVEDVRATLNPRMMENLMAGRISAKGRKFANQEMKRLDRAYVGVLDAFNGKNTEERMREASLYMIEKHGLERNRVFYVRDKIAKERESNSMFADQLQQDWNVKKKELGDKLRNGQIDLKEYYKQMDEWIRGNVDRNYIASEHDYSGMHGMQGIANLRDAYDDAGAIAHVMDCEAKMEGNKKGSVAELWSATKDATNFSIHEEYSSGYLSKDRYESLRDMFDWYVPLRKYDETTMEDVYTYIHGHVGSSNSIGMTVQKAKGRKSLSDVNILAQIGAMASGALYRGGSNEVRQAFARMVGEYEKAPANERVVTEIKGWAVKTTDSNGNIVWTEAHPPIPADDTNQETIAQEYYNWNQQMEAKKATGDAVEITGQSNIPYKFLPKGDRSQHIVSVWINGKRRDYLINGNPRAAQALNGMLNNESAKGALSAVNRFLAQSVTSWNPEFTLRNTVRDFGFASHLLEAKEGVNYWSKFEKHFFAMGLAPVGRTITAKSMNDVKNGLFVNLFKRYEQGTLDSNKPYHKWFAEFMDNGGMTGIATQQRFDEWKKKVVKDVAKMREGYMRHPWTLTKDIFSTIEVANEMAENITRFATFCASRESGRTAARSAYDAHEVSVNFNTRGSGNAVKTYSYEGMGDSAKALRNATGFFTGWMRNYTMFFNASVQSFCAFSRNIKAHPVRATATLMALPFAVGALMPWVNGLMQAWCDSDEDKKKLGIPDDPYGELPEFIRRDNLCFYIGKGEFVTVPLGIETRAFYGLGDLAAGYTFHPELQSQKNVAMDVAGQLSQIVPVGDFMSGSSFGDNAKGDAVTVLNKFLPSMYTPLSELVFNIDWKGQPIMRDGDYLDNSPSWMRAPRGTLTPLVKLNKKVNAETNDIMPGNENMKGDEVLDAMTNPALIEHLLDSYVGGTGTFVKRTGKVVNRAIIKAQGGNADIESKDIPFVRSLLYTPSETNAMARTKAKWYKYKEDIEKDAANMKVLKRRDVPLDEQIANFAQLQKLQNNANAQRVNIYERASKQIKRLNKRKARAQDDEESKYFDQQVNMIMEDAVKEMDAIKDK